MIAANRVPFRYDVHAMLYSDNAPQIEYALHQFLEEKRVNLVNPRREFYYDVELSEVEEFVKAKGLSAQFTKVPEAREYRESFAMRAEKTKNVTIAPEQEAFLPALGQT
jgi:hypothetical protein